MLRPRRRALQIGALVLPLALLGALKWRVDHPPLSLMDQTLRATLTGKGGAFGIPSNPAAQQITGEMQSPYMFFIVGDEVDELATVLRCTDERVPPNSDFYSEDDPVLQLMVPKTTVINGVSGLGVTRFLYWHTPHGSYLALMGRDGQEVQCAPLRPTFVPRFEAFIHRIAQRPSAVWQQKLREVKARNRISIPATIQ